MFKQALRSNRNRQPPTLTQQLPAPTKGWTAKGSPVDADPDTALVMDNWFPEAESIGARAGFDSFATQIASGSVETLLTFTSGSATRLFACGGGKIINITAGGSFSGAAGDVSGLTEDQWNATNFATAAGQFLVIANGGDDVRNYDGSSWTSPSITGVTSSTLVYPTAHKFRLWFAQIGTADLWYLATNAIAGAATKFSIGGLLKRGGYIMAIGTWSADAGDGMDDFFVIYSSEGEVIVYQGTDPADANAWSLVGVYRIGKPVGRRCMEKIGGDLALLSEDGIIPVSLALKLDRAVISEQSITANIRDAFSGAVRRARNTFGWQMVVHPIRNMAILNVPGSGSTETVQYVMNTTTGAWCRFKGMAAQCWGNYDNQIYFGTSAGQVYVADTGANDNEADIELAVLPAYNHLGARGRLKHVKMCQPIYASDIIDNPPGVSIAVDYETPVTGAATDSISDGFWTYDVSLYGGTDVYFDGVIREDWRGSGNIGTVVSPYTTAAINNETATNTYRYNLTGWTMLYEVGGVL